MGGRAISLPFRRTDGPLQAESTNEIADRASRLDERALQAGIEEAAKLEELPVEKCQRLPSQWCFGLHNIDILDDLIF